MAATRASAGALPPEAPGVGRGWPEVGTLDKGLSVARTVLSLRLAPVLLIAFFILWPLAGFPWWPIVFVVALGVLLHVLGFGYLLAGKRGPILLVGLLVLTTLMAWSPWAIATAVGLALAVRGLFLLPRYHLLAAGLVLAVGCGAGWTVETVTVAAQAQAYREADAELLRAKLLPGNDRSMLQSLMKFAKTHDSRSGCFLMTPEAQDQFARRWGTSSCEAAFDVFGAQVTSPNGYEVSPALHGGTSTESRDHEVITLDACGLYYESAVTGSRPLGGPSDIGRMTMVRQLKQGYRITEFRPC